MPVSIPGFGEDLKSVTPERGFFHVALPHIGLAATREGWISCSAAVHDANPFSGKKKETNWLPAHWDVLALHAGLLGEKHFMR